jgi:hypothetical protein
MVNGSLSTFRRILRCTGLALLPSAVIVVLLPAAAQAYDPAGTTGTPLLAHANPGSITCSAGAVYINGGTLWTDQAPAGTSITVTLWIDLFRWNGSSWVHVDYRSDGMAPFTWNHARAFTNLPKGAYTVALTFVFCSYYGVPLQLGASSWTATPYDFTPIGSTTKAYYCVI